MARGRRVDLATLIGLAGGLAVILGTLALGGGLMLFVDLPSTLIVVGGTFLFTLAQATLKDFIGSFAVGLKSFLYQLDEPRQLIDKALELADIARRNGLLALERQRIDNPFLSKGVGLCVDGHDPALVKRILSLEIDLSIERHEAGQRMFRNMAGIAPAMGLIGTLVGLVQMLAQMADPARVGPAMALALLTTLYGAVIAYGFATPIANKLERASNLERLSKELIVEAVGGIQRGMSPHLLGQLLYAYLPGGRKPGGG